jgi:Ni/Co efflux regulator RcnB
MQMNRVRIGLLVAAAAIIVAPTVASAQDAPREGRQGNRGGGGDRGGDRGDRSAPPQAQDRRQMAPPAQAPQAQAPQAQVPPERQRDGGRGDRRYSGGDRPAQAQIQPVQQPAQARAPGQYGRYVGDQPRAVDQRRGDDRRDIRANNDSRGNDRRDDNRWNNDNRGNKDNRGRGNDNRNNWNQGQRGWDNGRPGYNRPAWRNEWRGDRRYDWRNWRSQNSRQFRLPRYVPPRGYGLGYRSFSIGYRLSPYFYASSYWISDPWAYRLPPVYGPYRWVRYYNDVLLVDLETGEVVDVIQGFFW